jgi:hypothetical protein
VTLLELNLTDSAIARLIAWMLPALIAPTIVSGLITYPLSWAVVTFVTLILPVFLFTSTSATVATLPTTRCRGRTPSRP